MYLGVLCIQESIVIQQSIPWTRCQVLLRTKYILYFLPLLLFHRGIMVLTTVSPGHKREIGETLEHATILMVPLSFSLDVYFSFLFLFVWLSYNRAGFSKLLLMS